MVELFIFARFHAGEHQEEALEEALHEVVASSREETGCLGIHAFRAVRDARLFYVHSKWSDETAFELHAGLPHTLRFLERAKPLLDHPLENVTRAKMIC